MQWRRHKRMIGFVKTAPVAAMNKALQDPEVKEKILSQGNEMGGGTPELFAALIKAEAPRWGKVVRDAKIEPE